MRADNLLGGLREERARFYGSVISDDHARDIGNVANASDGTCGRNASPLLVHFVGSPKADFEKLRIFIEQTGKTFACDQPPQLVLPFLTGLATAFA